MTLPELGALMVELGADDALNLDGGGSSSFVFQLPGSEPVVNRPSDGKFRAVANHLGFRFRAATPENSPSQDSP
jgi:exopolysaccharide biosynthesis protein